MGPEIGVSKIRNVLLRLALISAIGFGGAAFASNNAPVTASTAAILVLQAQDGSVTLADGTRFGVPATINLASFNDREQVTGQWQQVGKSKVAASVSHAM